MNTKTTKRAERKPLFAQGPQAVSGDLDKNFQYRFVNDVGSRISKFEDAGYEFVEDPSLIVGDSRVSNSSDVGSAKTVTSNDGTRSYLMRIKKEWYDEDQAKKSERINEQEAAMKDPISQGFTGSIKTSR